MKEFEKILVKSNEEIDSVMRFRVGGSWDYSDNKYPKEYPAILVIHTYTKTYDFVCLSEFN